MGPRWLIYPILPKDSKRFRFASETPWNVQIFRWSSLAILCCTAAGCHACQVGTLERAYFFEKWQRNMTPTMTAILIGNSPNPASSKFPSNADCQPVHHSHSPSISGKMTTNSTSSSLDVESTDRDQHAQSELDPLLGNDLKVLTKQEARSARAQFLALCWALFLIGWCDGSTGPLLPRIQEFYDVSCPYSFDYSSMSWIGYEFCRWGLKQYLGYLFWVLLSVIVIGRCQLPHGIFRERLWEQWSIFL